MTVLVSKDILEGVIRHGRNVRIIELVVMLEKSKNMAVCLYKAPRFLGFSALIFASALSVTAPLMAQETQSEELSFEDFLEPNSPARDLVSTQETQPTPAPTPNFVAEPPQDNLSNTSAPAPSVPLQVPRDVVSQDNGAAVQNQNDALPPVGTTRLRLKTEGFDNTASRGIDVNLGGNNPDRKSQQELAEEIRQEAFDAAITGLFPLKPEHIKALLQEYDKTQRAVEEPVNGVPTPTVNVETISLDPGVAPIALKTATGHITTVNILDVTGAPWPIQDIGWAGDFEVIEPEEGGHVIRIQPLGNSAYGNMSIRLLTLKTPITIMLTTGKDEVQYRVDARVSEYGPFAQAPLIEGGSSRVAGGSLIMSVLDGTPPDSASRLQVSGVDGRTTAYEINSTTYVRTPLTLLSPGWEQSVSSADGMNVYALSDTPVLLLSDRGRSVRANLTAGGDLFDE